MMDWSPLYESPLVERLGWVLVHALWEGALVAGGLALVLWLLRNQGPRVRYAASCTALALLLVLPAGTWFALPDAPQAPAAEDDRAPVVHTAAPDRDAAPAKGAAPDAHAASPSPAPLPNAEASAAPAGTAAGGPAARIEAWTRAAAAWIRPALPWLVLAWALGASGFAVRLAGGAAHLRRLRRTGRPAPDRWQQRLSAWADALGVERRVALRITDRVDGPAVAGWLKPVVLVPAGLLTGLPPEQVEALLRHELAHVRRHDVLVGWAQAAVETVLFFHPAAWWISARVRRERELCCDDLAVRAGADRLDYARALTAVAERRAAGAPLAAVAASDGPLLARIRRLLATDAPGTGGPGRLVGALAGLLLLALPLGVGACITHQGPAERDASPTAATAPADTAPADTAETTEPAASAHADRPGRAGDPAREAPSDRPDRPRAGAPDSTITVPGEVLSIRVRDSTLTVVTSTDTLVYPSVRHARRKEGARIQVHPWADGPDRGVADSTMARLERRLERPGRPDLLAELLEGNRLRADSIRARLDGLAAAVRARARAGALADGRTAALDSLRRSMEALHDSLATRLQGPGEADSSPWADLLRLQEKMQARMHAYAQERASVHRAEHLRDQARRLREQAERLEQQAREMEAGPAQRPGARPAPPRGPVDRGEGRHDEGLRDEGLRDEGLRDGGLPDGGLRDGGAADARPGPALQGRRGPWPDGAHRDPPPRTASRRVIEVPAGLTGRLRMARGAATARRRAAALKALGEAEAMRSRPVVQRLFRQRALDPTTSDVERWMGLRGLVAADAPETLAVLERVRATTNNPELRRITRRMEAGLAASDLRASTDVP
jgi:beta-lactamase regulating signal transducer with metallopeptidase domain